VSGTAVAVWFFLIEPSQSAGVVQVGPFVDKAQCEMVRAEATSKLWMIAMTECYEGVQIIRGARE
jgi:hypothetical protein